MYFSTLFIAVMTLSQGVLSLPGPNPEMSINDENRLAQLSKRATNCGMGVHDGSMCPDGAECNCAITSPVSLHRKTLVWGSGS